MEQFTRKQFVADQQRETFKRYILEKVGSAKHGDEWSYLSLEHAATGLNLGIKRKDIQKAINKLRPRILREYKLFIETIPDNGYRILTGDDHYYSAKEKGNRGIRRELRKTKRNLEGVNFNELKNVKAHEVMSDILTTNSLLNITRNTLGENSSKDATLVYLSKAEEQIRSAKLIEHIGKRNKQKDDQEAVAEEIRRDS